tara:strand:- start:87 stop:404 length:318 start_codon:yes stop_codon:yes gene_type:complete
MISVGIKVALRLLKRHGLTAAKTRASRLRIPMKDFAEARNMALKEPKKYLPKWDKRNKSKVQKTIEKRQREEDLKRRGIAPSKRFSTEGWKGIKRMIDEEEFGLR